MIPGLYILIPAKNEEKNIAKTINNYKRYGKIVIVNDRSSDRTLLFSKNNTFKVLNNQKTLGYDFSLRKGINFIKKKNDSKYILTIDGDGEHPLVNLNKIIKYMKNYDLIIFNREKLKRISEYLINIISIFIYGIRDPLSGMKLYKVNVLKKKSILKENVDYVGMFFFKLYNKNKILNLPIKSKNNKKSSFGNGLSANIKIIKAFLKCI
jgi:glycosyltransferase involved in cell wall biosynthesis